MKPIYNFIIKNYNQASAWKEYSPEPEDDDSFCENYKYIADKDCLMNIEWMMEVKRPLVERNYHYERKHVYDYYFKLFNDLTIYAVQTNIRMNKYFSGKWYWYLDDYKTRMFKFDQIIPWKNILAKSYPVDDDGNLFFEDSEEYDVCSKKMCLKKFYDQPEGYLESYVDEIFSCPYTSLRFLDDIPKGATIISLPPISEFTKASTAEKIALILTLAPSHRFDSEK
jgi:hypothetical protein